MLRRKLGRDAADQSSRRSGFVHLRDVTVQIHRDKPVSLRVKADVVTAVGRGSRDNVHIDAACENAAQLMVRMVSAYFSTARGREQPDLFAFVVGEFSFEAFHRLQKPPRVDCRSIFRRTVYFRKAAVEPAARQDLRDPVLTVTFIHSFSPSVCFIRLNHSGNDTSCMYDIRSQKYAMPCRIHPTEMISNLSC